MYSRFYSNIYLRKVDKKVFQLHLFSNAYYNVNANINYNVYSDSSSCRNDDGNSIKKNRPVYKPEEKVSLDDPPTTCCMSGCPNCVYIAWAEALVKQMKTTDPMIAKKILENVEDPGMKAFLTMELRNLGFS